MDSSRDRGTVEPGTVSSVDKAGRAGTWVGTGSMAAWSSWISWWW